MTCIASERPPYHAARSGASIGSSCIFRERDLELRRQQPPRSRRNLFAAACTSRKPLPSLFVSRLTPVARAAKHLQIQVGVGAPVFKWQNVIDVRVLAVADFVARSARKRVTYKNALTLGDPVRGKVMRSLLRWLHAALVRWFPSWNCVWHSPIQSRLSGSWNLGRMSSSRR